jgi:hypothetical protein
MIISRHNERSTAREAELVRTILDSVEELAKSTFYAKKVNCEIFINEGRADMLGLHKDIDR